MRPLHSALVAGLLALLCVGGWLLVRSSTQRVEVASAAPAATHGDPAAGGDAQPLLRAPASGPKASTGTQRVASEVPPEPALDEPAAPAREGLTVTGRVVDSQGEPIAGARVLAASSGSFGMFAGLPLDVRGAGTVGWMKLRETTSRGDGRFELEGLRPGSLRLAVRSPGRVPLDDDGRALPDEERVDLGDLRLEPSVLVAGRVLDPRGAPVEGAEVLRLANPAQVAVVRSFSASSGTLVARTAADGSFAVDELAPGPWALRVETPDHPHAVVSGTTARTGERVEGLVVALEAGLEIAGSVRDLPAGEALIVRALPRGAGPEPDFEPQEAPAPPPEARVADVAADGSFLLRGLRASATYELSLTRKDRDAGPFGFFWSPGLAAPVKARAGERGVVLVYQPESALVFQAVDARTGTPVEEFTVEAGIDWPLPQMDDGGRPLRARPEGRARVGNLRPRSPSDKATLRVAAVGYAPYELKDLALIQGRDTDLGLVHLEPLPLLTVRVLDGASAAPLEGASVTLSEVKPARRGDSGGRVEINIEAGDLGGGEDLLMPGDSSRRARTDAAGLARLTIPVGAACRLTVKHDGHAPWRSEVFPAPTAASEREVRLGEGGRITAHLLDAAGEPVAGGRVEHQGPGADGGFAATWGQEGRVTNAQGEVVFDHLEPGTHRFRRAKGGGGGFFADGGGAVAIRMSGMPGEERGWVEALVGEGGSGDVELLAPLEVAVEGRVREAGEPLAGATVELARREPGGETRPRLPMLGGTGPRGETDGQGRYRLEGVEPGEYTLTVRHPTRAMPTELDLLVREGDLRQDVELSVAIVEGRVTDAEGKALAGVRVRPERARPRGRQTMVRMMAFASSDGGGSMISLDDGGFASVQARTDADGRYQLRGVAHDVELEVHAEGKGLQPARSKPFQVAHDEVRRGVDLQLETAGQIEVLALRADGSPARNLLVTATYEGPLERKLDPRTEFVGEEGKLVIDGLTPGTWRLATRTLGPEEGGGEIPEQTVEVRAGETTQAQIPVP